VRTDHHSTLEELMARVKVNLHGVRLGAPDLSIGSHSLAVTANSLSSAVRWDAGARIDT
jgi:hypothetical protein